MKKIGIFLLPFCISSHAELVGLDEESMESVSGQTGVGMALETLIEITAFTYSDDVGTSGGELKFTDINISSSNDPGNSVSRSEHVFNVNGTEGLYIDSIFEPTRIQIGGISVGEHIGNRSFGKLIFDFEGERSLQIGSTGTSGFLINSTTSLNNAVFQWSTNANSLRMQDITIDNVLTDSVFEEKEISPGQEALVIDIAAYQSNISVGSICFSELACVLNNSIGSVARSLNLIDSQLQIHGGGREGDGITMNMHFEYDESVNLVGDGNFTSYTDDATIKFANQSGVIDVVGFTFDIGTDEVNIGDHIATQFDQVSGNHKIGNIEIAGKSVGEFESIFNYSDATHDLVDYENKLLIAPGVAFAAQDLDSTHTFMTNFYNKVGSLSDGISLFKEWNMQADFIYTDDTHSIRIDNFKTYGSGYVTLDLRSGGANSIDSSNGTENFLAIGIKDYHVNYGFDGFKIGDDTSQLQSGYELLGISPHAKFTMNAAIEIRGGGADGSGVTFDGDVLLSDANFAVTRDSITGNGLYLDDALYEFHFRDVTLDVDSQGIQLVLGELWSEFTINDVRFGDKNSGSSLGALVIKQYQTGSQVTISGGGAGSGKCIAGSGNDLASCTGNWIDPETQGLTVSTQAMLQKRNGTKENSVTWETNRVAGTIGTGTSIKADNIYSSDGYDDTSNTHGIQTTTSIDIAKTRVLKKSTGVDSNGIAGNEGDELITTGKGATDYTYEDPLTADKTSRAEGLILSNNVQIKELNIESIQMLHPAAGGVPDTLLHGVKLQNLNMTSTLSVTPIR